MFSNKFYILGNLMIGTVGITFGLTSWFMTEFFNGAHLLMVIGGTWSITYALTKCNEVLVDVSDSVDVIDDYEWGTLDAMLKNYRRHYENSYKGTAMYESGMRDIDGWLWQVEELRTKK